MNPHSGAKSNEELLRRLRALDREIEMHQSMLELGYANPRLSYDWQEIDRKLREQRDRITDTFTLNNPEHCCPSL